MNFIKAQIALLKAWDKKLPGMMYGKWDDEHIAFTLNGANVVIIPNKLFYLDSNKAPALPKSLFEREILHPQYHAKQNKLSPWCETGIVKEIIIGRTKIKAIELTDTKNYKYLDEKLLKVYKDSYSTFVFKSTEAKSSPVYLYDYYYDYYYDLVGLIMPLNMEANSDN